MWPLKRLTRAGRVLRRARRIIQQRGWSSAHPKGPMTHGPCAAGAIRQAGHSLKIDSDEAMHLFAEHNGLPPRPSLIGRVTVWNDKPYRLRGEVLSAFRHAEQMELM